MGLTYLQIFFSRVCCFCHHAFLSWLINLKHLKLALILRNMKSCGFKCLILCLIAILPMKNYAEKTPARSRMTTLTVKQYIKALEKKPNLLVKSLNKLKLLQEVTGQANTSLQKPSRKQSLATKRKIKKRLKQTSVLLSNIYALVADYFQAERSTNVQSKLYLKLRKTVWLLLNREQKLFQGSNGRFCLRAVWERLLAQSYLSVNQYKRAQHHFLRAYQCGGSVDDLTAAQKIKH